MSMINKVAIVLDDDADIRRMVRKILETAGMKVFEAEKVSEALALAKQKAPHFFIIDLNIPDENGFQFLEKRRLDPDLRTTPVFVLSQLKDRPSVYQAMSLGATD